MFEKTNAFLKVLMLHKYNSKSSWGFGFLWFGFVYTLQVPFTMSFIAYAAENKHSGHTEGLQKQMLYAKQQFQSPRVNSKDK